MPDNPSRQVVLQRVRNRIIEYLDVACSAEAQRHYERDVPIAHVPAEMFCWWEDFVSPPTWQDFTGPVFSPNEIAAMRTFGAVWERVSSEVPEPLPHTIEHLLGTEPWTRLMAAAGSALEVFRERGRFSEDVEVSF
jgi:hypothetical protein